MMTCPLMVVSALAGKSLPVYGDEMQIRNWLYLKDHCTAIRRVLDVGLLGECQWQPKFPHAGF